MNQYTPMENSNALKKAGEKNPELLSTSSENIITEWDFFWGKFVFPTDTTTKPDLTVKAPSDWNKYPLPDEIRKIAKTGKGSGTYRLRLTNLKPRQSYAFLFTDSVIRPLKFMQIKN